jgi:hypothetical protein
MTPALIKADAKSFAPIDPEMSVVVAGTKATKSGIRPGQNSSDLVSPSAPFVNLDSPHLAKPAYQALEKINGERTRLRADLSDYWCKWGLRRDRLSLSTFVRRR